MHIEIIIRVIALVLAVAALPGSILRVMPLRAETSHGLLPLLMTATGIRCWYAPVGGVIGIAAVPGVRSATRRFDWETKPACSRPDGKHRSI